MMMQNDGPFSDTTQFTVSQTEFKRVYAMYKQAQRSGEVEIVATFTGKGETVDCQITLTGNIHRVIRTMHPFERFLPFEKRSATIVANRTSMDYNDRSKDKVLR